MRRYGMFRRAALIAFVLAGFSVHAATLTGRVVAVSDGDTLTLLDSSKIQYKIRLAGIDAPEKKQAYGQAAKKSLSDLTYMKPVSVEFNKKDRFGRIVGKVFLNGSDICLSQVKRGLAWHYKDFQMEQNVEDRKAYAAAEGSARSQRVGLWKDVDPQPPWLFRKGERRSGAVR